MRGSGVGKIGWIVIATVGSLALLAVLQGPASSAPKGDVNADGRWDVGDVLKAQQYVYAIEGLNRDEMDAADVHPLEPGFMAGNGDVNLGDVLLLLQGVISESDADLDGDGLNKVEEFNAGTSDFSTDTDNDGLDDAIEVFGALGTSPIKRDSDGDGLSDGVEVNFLESDPSTSDAATHVGSTSGNFRVSESGAATYSIPLMTVAGTAGVVPQITLRYNSQAGNSLLGKGWFIDGISAITRCRQTLHQDGQAMPITWGVADRFCLNGRRLVVVSGEYGVDGSVYKTEIDSFVKVTLVAGAQGVPGNPDYFIVEGKDGSVSFMGNVPDGSYTDAKQVNAKGGVLSWAIKKFEDSVGNPIWYEYEDGGDGQRIHEVKYAYGSAEGPDAENASLRFTYADRPDEWSGYTAGYFFRTAKRLEKIELFDQAVEVREIRLSYLPSSPTRKTSRLEAVQECVDTLCQPPTRFTWSVDKEGFEPIGKESDLIPGSDNWVAGMRPADVNGDGLLDLIWILGVSRDGGSDVDHHLRYALSDGAKLVPNHQTVVKFKADSPPDWDVIDYNADGRSDAIVRSPSGVYGVHLSQPDALGNWGLTASVLQTPMVTKLSNQRYPPPVFKDFNSDGLIDVYYRDRDGIYQFRYLEPDPTQTISSQHYYAFGEPQPTEIGNPGNMTPCIEGYPCDWEFQIGEVAQDGEVIRFQKILAPGSPTDFNGDGQQDFLIQRAVRTNDILAPCDVECSYRRRATTKEAQTFSATDGFQFFDGLWPVAPQDSDSFAADFNGDGLTDLLTEYRVPFEPDSIYGSSGESVGEFLHLSNGTGFEPAISIRKYEVWNTVVWAGEMPKPWRQLIDYDGDGFVDLLYQAQWTMTIYVMPWNSKTDRFDDPIPLLDNAGLSTTSQQLFLDISGDGLPDYVRMNTVTNGKVTVYRHRGDGQVRQAITKITNGLGAETDIFYKSMANSEHYEQLDIDSVEQTFSWGGKSYTYFIDDIPGFYESLNGSWDLSAEMQTLGKTAPVLERSGGSYLVTRVDGSAPAFTRGAVDPAAKSSISYYYGEAKIQASGRGDLGFHKVRTVDEQTGVETTTTYRQDYPFIGYPLETEVWTDGKMLSHSMSTWSFQDWNQGNPSQPYQLVLDSSEEKKYDLETANLLSYVKTTNTFDAYGNNLTLRFETFDDDAGANLISSKTTVSEYGLGSGHRPYIQEKGRVTRLTTTHERPGMPGITRESAFEYFDVSEDASCISSGEVLKGLLCKEVLAPHDEKARLSTAYQYDLLGNSIQRETQGRVGRLADTGLQTRTIHWRYDGAGRHIEETINSKGHSEQVLERNGLGLPTRVANANGVETYIAYDAFGEEMITWGQTDAYTRSTRIWCSGNHAGTVASCPIGASFLAVVEQATGGVAWEYFDVIGRSVRSVHIGLTGSPVTIDRGYDKQGRKRFESEPYYEGDSRYGSLFIYDLLGRVIHHRHPDETSTVTSFREILGAQRIQVTNSKGQKHIEINNALGERISVTDHDGGSVVFEYSAAGNLTKTIVNDTDAATPAIVTSIAYDVLGNKTEVIDPDMGIWKYETNAFGELVWQQDAKLQVSEIAYDELGRRVRRIDKMPAEPDLDGLPVLGVIHSDARWEYDTAVNGLGQLARVSDSRGYEKTYLYDSLGRPAHVTTMIAPAPVGGTFTESTTYDRFGRVDQVFDAAGDNSAVRNVYNRYGYLYKVVDKRNETHVYYEVKDVDARGTPTSQELSDGVIVVNQTWHAASGRPQILKTLSAGRQVQYQEYQWDGVGNLEWRNDYQRNRKDAFTYDNLNRLRTTSLVDTSGAESVSLSVQEMRYDGFGNIVYKSDVGSTDYVYGTGNRVGGSEDAGPHALTEAGGSSYKYDDNGSMVESWSEGTLERQIAYTPFNKPEEIIKGTHRTVFAYGPDRSRYRRMDFQAPPAAGPEDLTITLYLGSVEKIVQSDGSYVFKRYVGGVIITTAHSLNGVLQSEEEHYRVKDHLGSLDLLLTQVGAVAQEFGFDAWGQRRNGVDWTALSSNELTGFDHSLTTRGYTGHEMLDEVGIIHMNGRIYDAHLGRFLQADVIVQLVNDLQSYNRYSYVLNNPLAFSDPSGHFIPAIIGIAVFAATGSVGWSVVAVGLTAFTQTLAMGGTFEQAAISGVSSAAFAFIGAGGIPGLSGFSVANFGFNLTNVGLLAAYGTVGGITNSLQKGNFGNGFVAAGISGLVGSAVGSPQYMPGYSGEFFIGVSIKSIVGGTLSEVTGGKFANGALSTAFTALASGGMQALKGAPRGAELTDLRVVRCGEVATCSGADGYALVTDAEAIAAKLPGARFDLTNGLRGALFSKGSDYLMTFGGTNLTSIWKDWITTNFAQGMGLKSGQYETAIGFAENASQTLAGSLRFAGHSLGGGLASAAAIVTGSKASIFNASGLHGNTVARHGGMLSNGSGLVNAYSSSYDILNVLQDFTPMPNGVGQRFQMGNAGLHSLKGVCGVSGC